MVKESVNFKIDSKVLQDMRVHCITAKPRIEYQEFVEQAIVEKLKRKGK